MENGGHVSVMLDEVESFIRPISPGMRICDATLRGGGYTARLLELCSECTVVGIDADESMIARARARIGATDRLRTIHGWFDEVIPEIAPVDRIVMDLGVSMVHLRDAERGFSFREDGPVDMRLDATRDGDTAADLIRSLSERDLADVIYRYGEERYSRRIARAICDDRTRAASGTAALAEVVRRAVPPQYRRGRNHPATRTFQALRIAVNDELGRIERAIPLAAAALSPGGRLIVVSFHSLEDRIVKHSFRALSRPSTPSTEQPMVNKEEEYLVRTKKPVVPSEEERTSNPASRSAKLRVLEKGTADV